MKDVPFKDSRHDYNHPLYEISSAELQLFISCCHSKVNLPSTLLPWCYFPVETEFTLKLCMFERSVIVPYPMFAGPPYWNY
jgi:hypothetical protein